MLGQRQKRRAAVSRPRVGCLNTEGFFYAPGEYPGNKMRGVWP